MFSVDGGTAVSYASSIALETVTIAPTLKSPEGGDHFALVSGVGTTRRAASIDSTTGVVTYTPSVKPGQAGEALFTVDDTDLRGVTTAATVTFTADGGTAFLYAPAIAIGSEVSIKPSVASPEGGDQFALAGASGAVASETDAFGTASIAAATGVLTFTPSLPPGQAGKDTFTVEDTDALGAETTATAVF